MELTSHRVLNPWEWLSDKVNDEISNHPELKTVSVGVYQFKNIILEVEVFALDHEGLVKPVANSLAGKTQEKKDSSLQRAKKIYGEFRIKVLLYCHLKI